MDIPEIQASLISPWIAITSMGDIKSMAPIAAMIAIGLAMGHAWRMALWWCLIFTASLGLVVVSKVAFIGWCIGSPALDFTGFSGHAMRATAIGPVLFYLLFQNASVSIRMSGTLLGLFFGAMVGISRLVLRNHSLSEVVAGCLLGMLVSLGFIYLFRTSSKFVWSRLLVALCVIALFLVPYSEPAPTQRWLVDVSLYLSGHEAACTRNDWQSGVRY